MWCASCGLNTCCQVARFLVDSRGNMLICAVIAGAAGLGAAEISNILEDRIKNFYSEVNTDEIGRVLSIGDGIAIVALLTFVNLTVATTLKTTLDIATVSYIEIAVVTGFVSGVVRWQILTANTVTASRRFTVVSAGISLVGVAVVTSFDTSLSKSIATPR